ncbi:unnamed protein product [Rotaria sordida]|uniref:Thioredoxin domain-containing protein n=1 Tax=Rotaria sordida TaxID=392033 RepID=A0A814TFZ1_9BILA|nr:unnamed protein product [Rotaria sordida]CAF3985277.1 unnamed protein product [Rotaria sordida]
MNEAWYDKLDEINHNDAEKPMITLGLLSFGVLAPFYVAYRKQQQEEPQEQSPLNKDEQRRERCSRMERFVDSWSTEAEYIDRVLFRKCNKESSNPDIFEKYNVKSLPTFLFIKNNEQVALLTTGDPIQIETAINDHLNGKK